MSGELGHDEVLRRIGHALATMDQRSFEVFERVRYRKLDYVEIGAELGLTIKQVERAFAGALLHISRCVDGDGGAFRSALPHLSASHSRSDRRV